MYICTPWGSNHLLRVVMEPKILCGSKVIRTPKSSSHEVIGSLGTTIILQLMYFETKVPKPSDLYQKRQQIPLCALHTATYLVPSPTAPRQGCNKSQQQVPGKLWTTHLKNMRKSNWIISLWFGVKIKHVWKHHPGGLCHDFCCVYLKLIMDGMEPLISSTIIKGYRTFCQTTM